MKNILTSAFILLFSFTFFAQSKSTKSDESASDSNIANREIPQDYVFNVKFHVIKNTNGTGLTQNIGEADFMNAMKLLNSVFNQNKIFFKYRGFDVIQNSTYTKIRSFVSAFPQQNTSHPLFDNLVSFSKTMTNPVYDYTSLNIYIVENIDINGTNGTINQTSGYGKYIGPDSAFTYDQLLSTSLLREIGKNFSLLRTYHNWNSSYTAEPGVEVGVSCENQNQTTAVRLTTGDLVADTPPCPIYSSSQISTNCTSYTSQTPLLCNSIAYPTINEVLSRNFMSPNSGCKVVYTDYTTNGTFTNGQKLRMRETIRTSSVLAAVRTSTLSLYQPYKVTIVGNVITHKFQKGFDYEFPDAISPDVSTANTNATPTNSHYSSDYRVIIDQIDTSMLANDYVYVSINLPPYGLIAEQNLQYVAGRILSSTSLGDFSNIKIKELSEEEVNNPSIEDNLEKSLFHVIIKTDSMGNSTQKVIYKK